MSFKVLFVCSVFIIASCFVWFSHSWPLSALPETEPRCVILEPVVD